MQLTIEALTHLNLPVVQTDCSAVWLSIGSERSKRHVNLGLLVHLYLKLDEQWAFHKLVEIEACLTHSEAILHRYEYKYPCQKQESRYTLQHWMLTILSNSLFSILIDSCQEQFL